ncbi:hypothetical protein DM49_3868 [Burkholderia mallei]|nr:hypothetical protein DM45_3642 [Burkholderia mallei]KOS97481.1 hypothetical protein DM49_3868 [Burkholderia mallei]KOT11050.1 hypothetical protein DM77_3175 [Burkholderia mallei]
MSLVSVEQRLFERGHETHQRRDGTGDALIALAADLAVERDEHAGFAGEREKRIGPIGARRRRPRPSGAIRFGVGRGFGAAISEVARFGIDVVV